MSLLLLKKKIQERIDGLYGEGRQTKASKNDILELKWVLCLIDELEKEEHCKHHIKTFDGRLIYCDRYGEHERFGHTFPLGAFPVPWSGRSEKEIRERIAELRRRIPNEDVISPHLEWILSKGPKE